MPELRTRVKVSLFVPTSEDIEELAILQDGAFADKRGCSSSKDSIGHYMAIYRTYADKYPMKLQHCRIAKDDQTGAIVGAIQLMMPGDPGDLAIPWPLRHTLQPGEAYLEWIGCHPNHTGKGVGSILLRWADDYALQSGARSLKLFVMQANEGAIRLYERKGYLLTERELNDKCDKLIEGCLIYFLLGCKYWSCCYMEKKLDKSVPLSKQFIS